MNFVKLYKNNGGSVEVKRVKVTQANDHYRSGNRRNLPFVREVEDWALSHGYSRRKPAV